MAGSVTGSLAEAKLQFDIPTAIENKARKLGHLLMGQEVQHNPYRPLQSPYSPKMIVKSYKIAKCQKFLSGFVLLSRFLFLFSGRYCSHIQDFHNSLKESS